VVQDQIDYTFAPTPFGEVLVAATGRGICALFFAESREKALVELGELSPGAKFTCRMTPMLEKALTVFEKDTVDVHLDLWGTPFQKAVWQALTEIPRGKTVTYSEIAVRVGRPRACRAVGSAVGANPVSVIVPCHRVLPRAGGMGGYRWGADIKAALLKNET
jgi:AraC family transcriptional regulator of adaptative response/methylated-DNA-[protein]-cysteine methyltransferase